MGQTENSTYTSNKIFPLYLVLIAVVYSSVFIRFILFGYLMLWKQGKISWLKAELWTGQVGMMGSSVAWSLLCIQSHRQHKMAALIFEIQVIHLNLCQWFLYTALTTCHKSSSTNAICVLWDSRHFPLAQSSTLFSSPVFRKLNIYIRLGWDKIRG